MSTVKVVEGELREEFGKNEARRLRRSGRIPAVVCGGGGPTISVAVDPKKVAEILYSAAGHNTLFTLEIQGRAPARVMLLDWQREPVHGNLLHVDMLRVAKDARLKVRVPVHLKGEPKGVKVQGGILDFILREVEVECLPDDIPEGIDVDITELTLGHHLRASELPLGAGVKLLTESSRVIAHVVSPKAEEEKPAAEAVEGATPAEPELIRKGKAEAEEGEEEGGEKTEKPEKKEGK